MPNAVYYVSYKLKRGASVPDFLLASENLNNGHISKQKGYISWQQLYDKKKDRWADYCTFETMYDLNNFLKISRNPGELAKKFYSFMRKHPFHFRTHFFTVEKSYGFENKEGTE